MKTNDSHLETGLADNIMDKLCLTPAAVAGIILLLVIPFIPPFNQEYMIRWLVAAALIGANAIAFDFTIGFINIVNFGYYAFLGFGGYTSAILAVNLGLSPWIGMIIGALFSGVLGFADRVADPAPQRHIRRLYDLVPRAGHDGVDYQNGVAHPRPPWTAVSPIVRHVIQYSLLLPDSGSC